jgi:hypothetical protein
VWQVSGSVLNDILVEVPRTGVPRARLTAPASLCGGFGILR